MSTASHPTPAIAAPGPATGNMLDKLEEPRLLRQRHQPSPHLWVLVSILGDLIMIVLAVPSNDFGGQEPGGKSEIRATAQGAYHVTFPMTEKVAVKGKDAHPFYRWAAADHP